MRLKLIACDVLLREICHLVARSPHVFDLEFTEKNSHNQSDLLRQNIQEKIDSCADKDYDAILLGYGLCGNSTVGLASGQARLIIPRAHDCCTLFLGSRERFKEHFKDNPSQPFSSPGYLERSDSLFHDGISSEEHLRENPTYQEYIQKYGEENARYIYETMYGNRSDHNRLVYIEIPETCSPAHAKLCRERAVEGGMEFVPLEGSLALLEDFIFGNWNEDDFFILNPGERLVGIYDWDRIIGSVPV